MSEDNNEEDDDAAISEEVVMGIVVAGRLLNRCCRSELGGEGRRGFSAADSANMPAGSDVN